MARAGAVIRVTLSCDGDGIERNRARLLSGNRAVRAERACSDASDVCATSLAQVATVFCPVPRECEASCLSLSVQCVQSCRSRPGLGSPEEVPENVESKSSSRKVR